MDDRNELREAVEAGDWKRARHLAAIRVADMMVQTDSPREVTALSISLDNLIDKCEKTDAADSLKKTRGGKTLTEIRKIKK